MLANGYCLFIGFIQSPYELIWGVMFEQTSKDSCLISSHTHTHTHEGGDQDMQLLVFFSKSYSNNFAYHIL